MDSDPQEGGKLADVHIPVLFRIKKKLKGCRIINEYEKYKIQNNLKIKTLNY